MTSSHNDKNNKDPSVVPYPEGDDRRLFIVAFAVCGVMAALLLSAVALYIYRRHSRSKDKLQKLSQVEEEPTKDYEDLCRARMANKNTEKPENAAQRIRSVSKESEGSQNSPSSRSSTSSCDQNVQRPDWQSFLQVQKGVRRMSLIGVEGEVASPIPSPQIDRRFSTIEPQGLNQMLAVRRGSEEPVTSNMDISTGHMVLSYMEDHLKNKDRLEQEWLALCAYEAEPCSTEIATKSDNQGKNRYKDVLPFDHSRVVLSEVSNISGSDYINASTITDHDPRNPAYILTQGPLQMTTADFWQLVWEQGSVVIVMLTKLTEGGQAMCHRYWPEEGAELYHIYEVHLVSEHIWCEDYLVRSFYLKNVKTAETRTVTQFHFLSWPDQGVPSSIKALLEFRRKVNKSYRGRSCPIVVHCSDGVGRSGTYCLMDMVLNRMAKGAKEIDIAATLEHIRDQRSGAVATRAQFEFTLMAVAEEVHAILKALPQ